MDVGSIDAEIINSEFESCFAQHMNQEGVNDFIPGEIDVFNQGQIGSCFNFSLPDGNASIFKLYYHGPDALRPELLRIILDSQTFLQCPDGEFIDNVNVPKRTK